MCGIKKIRIYIVVWILFVVGSTACYHKNETVKTNKPQQVVIHKDYSKAEKLLDIIKQGIDSLNEIKKERSKFIPKVRDEYQELINAGLKKTKLNLYLSKPYELTKGFYQILNLSLRIPDHGLNLVHYPVRQLVKAQLAFEKARTRLFKQYYQNPDPLHMAVFDALVYGKLPDKETAYELTKDLSMQDIEKLNEFIKQVLFELKHIDRVRMYVEGWGMEAFFRLCLDFKHLIIAHPFKAIKKELRTPKHFFRALLKDWEKATEGNLENFVKNLVPQHPYYAETMAGLRLYRDIAAKGGFVHVPYARVLKKGMSGRDVLAVKRRLAQEGYEVGELTPVFDEQLQKAVKHFQYTHQYKQTGVVDRRLVRSMNKSVYRRIKMIKLSLQRWRESDVDPNQPLYVRVNIPQFVMEVWEKKHLVMQHEVIVGNNNWTKDPIGMMEGRLNRTKLFSAKIKRIVINPLWHVPSRIQKEEIYRKNVIEEPDYFVKHNFKVKLLPDGSEQMFQEAGDENALGRVKFVFPNPYAIFMHDTDEKKLFEKEIRAFSHGCIRLHKPLEVAFYILNKVNGMTKEEFDRAYADTENPTVVKLKRPVPIYIEYNTVSVDKTGKMMFFIDIYQYDKDYFDGKIPYTDKELELLLRKIKKVD